MKEELHVIGQTTIDAIVEWFENNRGAHTTRDIKGVKNTSYASTYFLLRALETKGKIVRERIAGRHLWTWKDHVPGNMSVQSYLIAMYDGLLVTEVKASNAGSAGEIVRGYEMVGMHPVVQEIVEVTKIFRVKYQWPDKIKGAIEEEERQIKERRKQSLKRLEEEKRTFEERDV